NLERGLDSWSGGKYVYYSHMGEDVDPDDTANTMAPSAPTQVTKAAVAEDHITGDKQNGVETWDRGWSKKGGVYTFPTTRYLHMPGYQGGGGDGYIEGFTYMGPKWALTFDGSNLKYTLPGKERQWPIPPGETKLAINTAGSRISAASGRTVTSAGRPVG